MEYQRGDQSTDDITETNQREDQAKEVTETNLTALAAISDEEDKDMLSVSAGWTKIIRCRFPQLKTLGLFRTIFQFIRKMKI